MPSKPKQLKSGSWRSQVSTGVKDDNGRYIYDSVTANTEKKTLLLALQLEEEYKEKRRSPTSMTLGEAADAYIKSKDGILSPTTTAKYKQLRRKRFQDLADLPIKKIDRKKIQEWTEALSREGLSPKSVRNAHGFLSTVLRSVDENIVLRTKLPNKIKYSANVPNAQDLRDIFRITANTDIELPVLLAVYFGMRMGEVLGVKFDDIRNGELHISESLVLADGETHSKAPKSYEGDRRLSIPKRILDCIERQPTDSPYIVKLSGSSIYKKFVRCCETNGLAHFRFHDLRLANASAMLLINIPDKYAMERMGHATNSTLKTVYQHTLSGERELIDEKVNAYFDELLSHELSHE